MITTWQKVDGTELLENLYMLWTEGELSVYGDCSYSMAMGDGVAAAESRSPGRVWRCCVAMPPQGVAREVSE